jgi:hypothetical protein
MVNACRKQASPRPDRRRGGRIVVSISLVSSYIYANVSLFYDGRIKKDQKYS